MTARQTHRRGEVPPPAAEVSDGRPRHPVCVGCHRRDGISVGVDEQVWQDQQGHHQERPREVLKQLEVGRHARPERRKLASLALFFAHSSGVCGIERVWFSHRKKDGWQRQHATGEGAGGRARAAVNTAIYQQLSTMFFVREGATTHGLLYCRAF